MVRGHGTQPFDQPQSPIWLRMALLAIGYFLCAWLGRFLSGSGGTLVSYWLPGGLFVSVLLLNPSRDWPWLMLSIIPANSIFDFIHDPNPNPVVIALFCLANIIQSAAGAWLVRRFVAGRPVLKSLREFFGLMFFSGVIGSAIGATIGASMLVGFHLATEFWTTWRVLWGGDIMAVLVLAPLILVFCGPARRALNDTLSIPRIVEALVVFGGLAGFLWYVLVRGEGIDSPKAPALAFVLWAGVRFGLRGGTLAVVLLAFWMAFLTTHYLHGLSSAKIASGDYVFTLQLFVAVAALVALVPAILLNERDLAMAKLRESQERFRTLTEAAFEGIFISEDGRILDANDQGLRMFGYERAEMLGKTILDLVAPGSQSVAAEAIQAEQETIMGHELVRKDGSSFFGEARARIVRIGHRKFRMTALRDITERKRTEQALRESEEKFSKAFRASPDGLAISELETGLYIEINEGYCKLYGYLHEEMVGHTSVELGIWDSLQDRERLVQTIGQIGTVRNLEVRTRTRTGEIRYILLSADSIELDGRTCIVSVLHDVTDRILAERALRASEESLRATIENAPHVAVQWFDRQGRVTYWNAASEQLYGWPASLALGKTLDQLIFTEEQAHSFQQVIADIHHTGKPFGPAEFHFRHRHGNIGVILSTVFQITIPSGEPCFVCMDVDLTQRKQAEESNRTQMQVLEMIASGQPIKPTLDALLRLIEKQYDDVLCSLLLLDSDSLRIRHGSAPSLPKTYVDGVDGQAIGPCAGSCGTAAYRREPVFVSDIASDPLWVNYRQLALSHGLRACWSTPIFDSQRKVLGTFAVYRRQPGLPDERHQQMISMVTHTAAICISRHQAEVEREHALAREQEARIEYTLQLIASQESERKRIAAELHDSMGQNLLLIKNLTQLLQQSSATRAEYEQIATINQLAAQCIAEARRISRDLHPYQLDHLGLKRALESMLEQTAQASRIEFTSKFESVDELFSGAAAMHLYRIVQESLNNILKHSEATHVDIRLERDIHEVQLRIEDDGIGFEVNKAGGKKGLGLRNITERTRMLGGRLKLTSAPGRGAKIEVFIPIHDKPSDG